MSPIERFILRYKAARYAFVLISFPIVAIRYELSRLRYYRPETGMDDLLRALAWARRGGMPGQGAQRRPEPAPFHPKWQREHAGLCGHGQAGPCFEDDFTGTCPCWCHQVTPVTGSSSSAVGRG